MNAFTIRFAPYLPHSLCVVLLGFLPTAILIAQKPQAPLRVWSVGPLTKSEPVMGVSFGSGGATFTGPHTDSQTSSTFAATRSVVFAGDRIVIESMIGMKKVEGAQMLAEVYEVLSLDAQTGKVKDKREFTAFGSMELFSTNDDHVIASGRKVVRLTPDLKEENSLDYAATGHKYGRVQNISPDGSTLGNATSPGFQLIDAKTLAIVPLTSSPSVDTSVSSKGFITDNIHWIGDYPNDTGFVTYFDSSGEHLIYHGSCSGRPQFLSDELVLILGCKNPSIIDVKGNVYKTLVDKGAFSFAGVSRNGKRLAMQLPAVLDEKPLRHEKFVIYSVDSGEVIAEIAPDVDGEGQSWSAFSAGGSMFAVGSPSKLTLYRLP